MTSEGTTQGYPSSMPSYVIGILPLLGLIKPEVQPTWVDQTRYADDLAGGSKLKRLKEWWDEQITMVQWSESWLIVKESEFYRAKEIFDGTGMYALAEALARNLFEIWEISYAKCGSDMPLVY